MEANNSKNVILVSEAQREVWEWKEALYQEIKDLPGEEQLKYIIEKTKETKEMLLAKRKSKMIKNNS